MPDALLSRVLVVDDEPDVAKMLQRIIGSRGGIDVRVETAATRAAQHCVDFHPQLVFTDLIMPGTSGVELLAQARARGCDAAFVVVSAYSTIANAVEAIRAGASDFLPKPFEPADIDLVLARVERELAVRRDAADLERQVAEQDPRLAALIGGSASMQAVRAWIVRARPVGASVVIEGDTGTGKELAARALHQGSGPFIAVNVAAIPDHIAESELFGHKAGAFSGAVSTRRGLLAEADGGTLFFDEINGMGMGLQAKVLRALEEKAVRPVGSNREEPARFRLIAASNESLDKLVEEGRFRRDLYHRLNVLHLRLPSLVERREDIPLLAYEFLLRYSSAHDKRARRFSEAALEWLVAQPWPGNVRQLENFIERLVIFIPDDVSEVTLENVAGETADARIREDTFFMTSPRWTLAEMERRYVELVLRHTGGNKTRAAQILNIDYKTLLRKIDDPRPSGAGT